MLDNVTRYAMTLGTMPQGWTGKHENGDRLEVLAADFHSACKKLSANGLRDFHTVREITFNEVESAELREQWVNAGEDEMRTMRAEALGHYA